jgi:hypothetical protein
MSSGMLRRVDLVRTDVSEELFLRSVRRLLVTASVVPSSPIQVTLMKEALPPKRRFLQEPRGVTSQKTPFFIVTAVKTSNLTRKYESTYTLPHTFMVSCSVKRRDNFTFTLYYLAIRLSVYVSHLSLLGSYFWKFRFLCGLCQIKGL